MDGCCYIILYFLSVLFNFLYQYTIQLCCLQFNVCDMHFFTLSVSRLTILKSKVTLRLSVKENLSLLL